MLSEFLVGIGHSVVKVYLYFAGWQVNEMHVWQMCDELIIIIILHKLSCNSWLRNNRNILVWLGSVLIRTQKATTMKPFMPRLRILARSYKILQDLCRIFACSWIRSYMYTVKILPGSWQDPQLGWSLIIQAVIFANEYKCLNLQLLQHGSVLKRLCQY